LYIRCGEEKLRLYLDDERVAPEGWEQVKTAEAAIVGLKTGRVEEMSLDYDLGTVMTGYDVLCWLEVMVFEHRLKPPKVMVVHSANLIGRQRMDAVIRSIEKLTEEWEKNENVQY
jgi:hypothetical protein